MTRARISDGEIARQAAGERAEHEAEHGDGERFAAVEAVEEEAAEKAGDGGGLAVAGDDLAELGGRDVQRAGEVGPERHHHREVEHVDELHGTDEKDDPPLERRSACARPAVSIVESIVECLRNDDGSLAAGVSTCIGGRNESYARLQQEGEALP